MFENEIYETILPRVLSRVKESFDKREGSIIWDATAPASFELAILYSALDYILNETFADTAEREHLLRRAAEYGMYPKPAGYAILRAELVGADVPPGARFSLENSELNYVVLGQHIPPDATWDGVSYAVKCETIGEIGNKYFGNLLPIDFIDGLQSAKLVGLLIPGEEEENTEVFRQRYFDSFRGLAFGGNVRDYVEKALALKGVGAVKVYPVWNHAMEPAQLIPAAAVTNWYNAAFNTLSPAVQAWLKPVYDAAKNKWLTVGGTVKLVILGADYQPASETLVHDVQEAIDPEQNAGAGLGIAPIGHIVNVFSAGATTIDISFDYELAPGFDWAAVQDPIHAVIDAYFLQLAKSWGMTGTEKNAQQPLKVVISQIANRLLDIPGIADIALGSIRLNGSGSNFTLQLDNIPVRGTVNGT